jgi:hypothetical protein
MSEKVKQARIVTITRNLYEVMPGARPVPTDVYGEKMWGCVDEEPHYNFCNSIANLIVRNSALTYVERD